MISKNDIKNILDKMILSASGWRGIFAEDGDEESKSEKISEALRIISGAASYIFAEYLQSYESGAANRKECKKTQILLGTDTRPTGKAIIEAMIPILLSAGCEARYAGVTAAPEIMAWARAENNEDSTAACVSGFIYISASHNPIGHNGVKFGLTDGGVLAADEAEKLIARFRAFTDRDDCAAIIGNLISAADPKRIADVYDNINAAKSEARQAYFDFCGDVVWGGSSGFLEAGVAGAFKDGLTRHPLGIVCDYNGSARTVSIDRDFFSSLGFKFKSINSEPGQIAHRIVPEGESLEPCRRLLEEEHSRDASFVLGYTPDCDGDRGNLVIWDDKPGIARALEAQEVFALACVAELSHLAWAKNKEQRTFNREQLAVNNENIKVAIAVNDPTSMRVDRIAEAFGVSVFRAEVGEANVVSLARKLREEGYLVRILGEGSAGGNITHPSAVRDPIHTVMAIAKMLSIRSSKNDEQRGFFEIWRSLPGQIDKYREEFTLSDIITSLPQFVTTAAYNKDACLRIKTGDHALLKDRYQQIFLREWDKRKDELKARFGFHGWEAIAYNGTAETRGLKRFGDAGRGGLKILFTDSEGMETAFIWMRGSATEPVFRIMADTDIAAMFPAPCPNNQPERYLLEWQRKMIIEADDN